MQPTPLAMLPVWAGHYCRRLLLHRVPPLSPVPPLPLTPGPISLCGCRHQEPCGRVGDGH